MVVGVASASLAIVAALCIGRLITSWIDSFGDLGFSLHHEKNNVPTINSALADGRVIVTRIQSQKVAEIPDCEHASAYVFDIGTTRSFVMKLEDYDPESISDLWPNSDFELVRTHSGNLNLRVDCYGTSLQPEFVIEVGNRRPEILWEIQEGIIESDFETYLASLVLENKPLR